MPSFLIFNKNPKQKNAKGFTLIELLIVVSIIAILVSIGAASFMRAQRQARDSQRKSDLGEVRSALEQFYGDNNRYPEANAGKIDCDGSAGPDTALSWGSDAFTCNSKTYLGELPGDPTSGQDYYYESRDISDSTTCTEANKNCHRFAISADLENQDDSDRDEINCNLPSTTHDYCVLNP